MSYIIGVRKYIAMTTTPIIYSMSLKYTLTLETINAIPKHKRTVEALGLRKMHKTVEMPDNAAVRGMVNQVKHLVKVEEI